MLSTPGQGFNFAIFNSSDFSLVLNALETFGETRVQTDSNPHLLKINAVGMISQISEEPYATTSQGNNSTVSSYGGSVEAGTSLTVIPYISDDNWLRLQYDINLSRFGTRTTEQAQANLPPPVFSNHIQGTVRIPSDYTIVLGSLSSKTRNTSIEQVHFLVENTIAR